MRPALLDTSVYISALRRGGGATLTLRWLDRESPLWLSSVVLEELYAGAGESEQRVIERLERDFDRLRRILVPNLSDWNQVGRLLSRLATKYGYDQIGQGRLTNDGLIAMSARRHGIRVLTGNERDYRRLAEFREFQWQLINI